MPFLRARLPHAVFFVSCACIMVVELTASRLVARHLGSSLYTWSAIIGVMLAGITAGNYLGGRLADRLPRVPLVGWLFLASAACVGAALGLNALLAATRPLRALGWPPRILLSVAAVFSMPAIAFGTLSPGLAKMAVERGRRVGSTLGSFYAVGTGGSIAGTFLTGYWLLFHLGAAGVTTLTVATLAAVGLALLAFGGDAPGECAGRQGNDALDPVDATRPQVEALLRFRYTPHALAFFSSLCAMALELLATRVVADQTGNSLYTWTSVIGVVLAGLSLGSYLGGRLSDRFAAARLLGCLLPAASAACAATLVLAYAFSVSGPFHGWHWPAVVFCTVLGIYFLPALLLGAFGPIAVRLAVERATTDWGSTASAIGRTIGAVSASSAAGSIGGTLASGFWLIPLVGSRSLTLLLAALLAGAGVALGRRRWLHLAWTGVMVLGLVATRANLPIMSRWEHAELFRPPSSDAFNAESAYQHVRVYDSVSDKDGARTVHVLALDYLIHGYVDPGDPTFLNYDYERIYRDVAVRYAGTKTRVSAFFLGGGSYTFPRWLMRRWPGSVPVVAEIDPMVLEANHRALGLPRDTPIRTLLGDARNSVDDLGPADRFDFFFGDAFNDLSVPYHLTTLEFSRKVHGHLAPGGAYLVDVIDSYPSGLFLGAFVNTLRQVFRHVYVFCTDPKGVTPQRDTFVVAASDVELDTTGWEPHHGTDFEGSVLTRRNVADLVARAGARILTDDDAPVENLMAPVVRERTRGDE
jgi:spermidine synthase